MFRILAVFIIIACPLPAAAAELAYDGFESETLSPIWKDTRIIRKDWELQTKAVRHGKSAIKITVNKGDHYERAPGNNPTERAELLEAKSLESVEGKTYLYSFSMFIPKDFPIVPTRLVLAQWKQRCEDPCKKDNPVIALRFTGGELSISVQTGDDKKKIFGTSENLLGNWLDFKFKIRFSRSSEGLIQASINGKRVLDYHGANSYPEGYGYPKASSYFFKMGLYRDRMDPSMSLYIDDYRKSILD